MFAVLLLVDSFHYIFARLLLPHLHPTASAFYVLAVGTAEVGVFALAVRKLHWRPALRHFWFFASIGFLIAGSTVLSYGSVAFLDPGTAAMLGKTGIIFSLALSVVWLRERLSTVQLLGAALAVVGVALIAYHPGDVIQIGSLLVLVSAFMYSLHAAIVKRHGQDIEFLDFFFYRLLSTTGFLLLFTAAAGHLAWPAGNVWPLLLVTGSVDVVISRTLYYITLRMFPMGIHTIILTLSPVVAIVVAFFLFGTFPGVQELIGGAAILAGVMIVTRR